MNNSSFKSLLEAFHYHILCVSVINGDVGGNKS